MKEFDIENILNPEFVDGALVKYKEEVYQVTNMDKTSISIENKNGEIRKINDYEWAPIILNKEWLQKFNLQEESKIINTSTEVDWVIRKTGRYYYITIKRDSVYGENPVIGLKYVHDLQRWFYILVKQKMIPNY
ncbi:MAG: hypothetical protein JJE55_14220 [Flavobacteriaceae bacterium]|nr:hypothetical protein [Flavobacteriaceae bacterium]